MGAFGNQTVGTQRCAYCGKQIAAHLTQCPFCREAVTSVKVKHYSGPDGNRQMRRGLLYMLLAAVIHYFAGGYGAPFFLIPLPAPMLPLVTQYLTPLLFLGGLGMAIYGFYLKIKS
jgi:hypothetical protein